MATLSSLLQGGLFAVINLSLLAYIVNNTIYNDIGIETTVAPRVLLFHFLMSFVLGMALRRAMVDVPDNGGAREVANKMPLFLTAMVFLYMTNITILITEEPALFVFPLFFTLYVYASIMCVMGSLVSPLSVAAFMATVYFMATSVMVTSDMVSDAGLVDDIAMFVSNIYDIHPSTPKESYLTTKGSVFRNPLFPVGISLFSFGYVYSSCPSF